MATVRTDEGVTIYYEEHGAGYPLVLAYGLGGNTTEWGPQVPAFSAKYQLILWDPRGHGKSDSPPEREKYGMERSATDLKVLLDHLRIERAYVGGLSMGGGISTRFTLRYPQRVAALLIIDSQSASGVPTSPAMRAMREKSIEIVETQGMDAMAEFAMKENPNIAQHVVHGGPNAVQEVYAMYRALNPAGYAHTIRAMLRDDSITEQLSQIRVPTLILAGDDDPALGPSRITHEKIAGSKLVVIPKASHLSNLDQPELFNRAVLGFLAEADKVREGKG